MNEKDKTYSNECLPKMKSICKSNKKECNCKKKIADLQNQIDTKKN